jgi:hypothetical protein
MIVPGIRKMGRAAGLLGRFRLLIADMFLFLSCNMEVCGVDRNIQNNCA